MSGAKKLDSTNVHKNVSLGHWGCGNLTPASKVLPIIYLKLIRIYSLVRILKYSHYILCTTKLEKPKYYVSGWNYLVFISRHSNLPWHFFVVDLHDNFMSCKSSSGEALFSDRYKRERLWLQARRSGVKQQVQYLVPKYILCNMPQGRRISCTSQT